MATYPNEAWPTDAATEMLDGTMDLSTGLPYIAKGTGPTSVPSLEVQYNRREHRLNEILAGWRQGMVVREADWKIGVYPIQYTQGGARRYFAGVSGVAVAEEVVKVAYLDEAAALVLAHAWPVDITSYLPLAIVDTTGGRMRIEDVRSLAAFHVPALESETAQSLVPVTAFCPSLGANQSDVQFFAFMASQDLVLTEVQVFCTAVSGAVSVNVKEAGSSLLSTPAVPGAGVVVKPALGDGSILAGNNLTVHVTTDAAGGITNLAVTLVLKARLAA